VPQSEEAMVTTEDPDRDVESKEAFMKAFMLSDEEYKEIKVTFLSVFK